MTIDFPIIHSYNFSNSTEGGITLKFLKQFCLIILFSFLGELCRWLIPYPIPGSIYGMVLLFAALALKIIKIGDVRDAGGFLVSVLPILFVAPVVNLVDYWGLLQDQLIPLFAVILLVTIITFGVAGKVTQWLISRKGDTHE